VYDYLGVFNEGLTQVIKDDKWGVINTAGKTGIPIIYQDCRYAGTEINTSYYWVQQDSKWGIISITRPVYKLGHVSGGETLVVDDARLILQHLVKKIILTPDQLEAALVSLSDEVGVDDARLILQMLVKKIEVFPRAD